MYAELAGKIALVTGASRGFGRAIAMRLASEGAYVFLNYRRSRSEAELVLQEIIELGGRAELLKGDIGSEEKITAMFDHIQATQARLDILVANASFGIPSTVLGAKSKYWDVTLNSTSKSLLLMAQRAVPLMKGWGRIVTVTSYGGQRVLEHYGVVGVAKGAVESLTRSLAVELAPHHILVNGVMPGLADTKSFRAIPGAQEALDKVVKNTPSRRAVQPKEVANVVTFLCSDQADMIVGQFITIDGGAILVG